MASIYPKMLFSYACGFLDAEIQTDFYLHSFELQAFPVAMYIFGAGLRLFLFELLASFLYVLKCNILDGVRV